MAKQGASKKKEVENMTEGPLNLQNIVDFVAGGVGFEGPLHIVITRWNGEREHARVNAIYVSDSGELILSDEDLFWR